ncbi:hypothetical protein BC943DRAFT_357461 [Umbelopsis sp. AD052]|nr:hypothetical protein BC943DRAFT_357461 [Umbelopsis sp. AD052]
MASIPQPDLPATMRVLQISGYGDCDVLQYVEAQAPRLLYPTDIIIRVHAAGVNPVEDKARQGNMALLMKLTFPYVLGRDFCGTIVSKGDEVKDFNIGDEVFGTLPDPSGENGCGTYAEYARVPATKAGIAVKPTNVSAVEAGAAGIAVFTAWRGIVHHGKVKTLSSPKVIFIGASGGVGSYGVQIAKAFGAYVIAVCSGKNAELAKKLGADQVLDYTVENSIREFSIQEKDTVDIIFDAVGGDDYWNLLSPTLKPSGVYTSAVGPIAHGGSQRVGFMDIAKTLSSIAGYKMFGSRKYQYIYSLPYEDMPEITKLFEEGKIKSYVPEDQIFPLKDGAKAHKLIASHRAKGKVVLVMD